MNWTDDYIGIPFDPKGNDRKGVNCWTLICLVYRERLGIYLDEHQGVLTDLSRAALIAAADVFKKGKEAWAQVEKPKPYDVVLLRTGKYQWHSGVVVDRRSMLHVLRGIDSMIESFTGPIWANRVEEFRRYAE